MYWRESGKQVFPMNAKRVKQANGAHPILGLVQFCLQE